MYVVEDKGGAIALMIASLCFLGTWPAILNSLERKGRLLQHSYLDYSITSFLGAVIIAFTLGQIGSSKPESPNFLTQLGQDNWPSVAFALAGGLVLSVGNLATQYAWPFVGLSATNVISSSLSVLVGGTLNYFLDGRINRAELLFPGIGFFLFATSLGSLLYASNTADTKAKVELARKNSKPTAADAEESGEIGDKGEKGQDDLSLLLKENASKKESPGSAEFFEKLNAKRTAKFESASYIFGLAIVFFAGFCYALFSPAINLATNDQWHYLKPGVPHLVVYTAFFYFSCAAFAFGFGINLIFLYRPMLGLPKSTISAWLRDWEGRWWAFSAGLLCSCGNGFQFMGGEAAGFAAADCVNALPLVSTVWAILIFKEYHQSSRRTYVLLVAMLMMFTVAVVLLASSAGQRS
ncbi:unnamed protein product [Calypogeia fissa]